MNSKQHHNNSESYVTSDYKSMMRTVMWSSVGMFYLEFVVTQFSQLIGIGASGIGFMISMMTLGNIVFSPIMGILADKLQKSILASVGIYGRALSYLIVYAGVLLRSRVIFFIGGFILGATVQAFWIPFNAMVAEKSHKHHRSKAYAQISSVMGIGMAIGATAGFVIFFYSGAIFPDNLAIKYSSLIVFAAMNIWSGIIFGKKINPHLKFEYRNANGEMLQEEPTITLFGPTQKYFKAGLIVMVFGFFIGAINESVARPFLQLYILENITSNTQLMTFIYIPTAFTMFLAPYLGRIGDKVDPRKGIVITIITGSLVTLLLINVSHPVLFSLVLVLDNVIARTEGLIFANFVSRITKEHRGKLFGMRETFSNLGFMIGPIIGGILWNNFRPQAPFILSIFVELALIPIILVAIIWIKPGLEEK